MITAARIEVQLLSVEERRKRVMPRSFKDKHENNAMPILKLTPESSDEHCGLPIFLSKITDENSESTLSMMCGTPLWHGTWDPG